MSAQNMSSEARVRIPPNVYSRAFGDEIVLLDFKRGEYFGLDSTAAEIWRRLEAGDTLIAVAKALVERYEVTQDRALEDVVSFVSQMSRENLVELA